MDSKPYIDANQDTVVGDKTIRQICRDCWEEVRIEYSRTGSFFGPRLKGINHLQVGDSSLIDSPLTIFIEKMLALYIRFTDAMYKLKRQLFPKKMLLHGTKQDCRLVGNLTFAERADIQVPVHHMELIFWGRTRLGQWKMLSAGYSDEEGKFDLPFDLRAACSWRFRKLIFEINQISHVYYEEVTAKPHFVTFRQIPVPKGDLIGMSYNLRNIQLYLWEYRRDIPLPRVMIKDHDKDAPQYYSKARENAIKAQFIPIELTKLKHAEIIKVNPDKLSIELIQADYPKNLTVAIEEKIPGYTRSDDWFAFRFMNGMNNATYLPDPADPSMSWIYIYGSLNYKVNDQYAFPSVGVQCKMSDKGIPMPIAIELTGPISAWDKNPYQKHRFTPEQPDQWLHAKRAVRVSAALSSELDDHFAGTHVNTEQYAVAAYRNLRLSPVANLLFPHLKEVVLVNKTADEILIGPGYIPSASAMTAQGIVDRCVDVMGALNWKDWTPMKPLSDIHYYALAENLFWEVVEEYVDEFFVEYQDRIIKYWHEVYCFSEDLVNHSVPMFQSGRLNDENDPERTREAYYAERYRFNPNHPRRSVKGQIRAISPITENKKYNPDSDDWNHLKQACKYAIMVATFMHTWVNEHQYEDIGEVKYSSLGLRFGEKPEGIILPESDTSISPDLLRSTQMMWFSNLLSRTEFGFITRDEEGDINPLFKARLMEHKETFLKYGIRVEDIESRTNI